jgi:threonine dehydrogenase-like Zn-dependent dehydrogenase
MKAIVVTPRKKSSIRLIEVPKPTVNQVSKERGVLVQVLQAGLDGTDREIMDGEYGELPPGEDYLILGHESLGIVVEVGEDVREFQPGDFVSATVRRPGTSIYDEIGMYDFTTDDIYFERGITRLHGFLTEYYVEMPQYLVQIPAGLKHVGVLLEPLSIVEKGIYQAFETQERLKVWSPRKAAVLGAGPLGLLAALVLRLRNLEVTVLARTEPPYLKSKLVEQIGGRYLSTKHVSLEQASVQQGPFDIIFEATGYSPLVFEAMKVLAKNGVLILSSVTGGDRRFEVEGDKINLSFVLGNKVCFGTVNANKSHFEFGVMDLAQGVVQFPGWLDQLLTHPIVGLDCSRVIELLQSKSSDILKVFCQIAPIP